MSNPYNGNQPWDQSRMLYSQQSLQLEDNYPYDPYANERGQRQQLGQQSHQPIQSSSFANPYQYTQPSGLSSHSSSLQGAFQQNNQTSQPHVASYSNSQTQPNVAPGAYSGYGPTTTTQPTNSSTFRSNPQPFTFGANSATTTSPPSTGVGATFLTTSPDPIQENYPQQPSLPRPTVYYPSTSTSLPGNLPSNPAKRRAIGNEDISHDEHEQDSTPEQKDAKAKPTRACARCKNLKVRCEVKNEGDPCKRCLNGGHDCFIPGRKVRRVPPKREHLISQIQSQAKEIERLMTELEKFNAGRSSSQDDQQHQLTASNLNSPVLSPSTTDPPNIGYPALGQHTSQVANPATNKAIEEWIAKTRENMQELSFICVSGAGAPESYLVEEDSEDYDSSGDDEFVEAAEDFEYEVSIEDADGGDGTVPQGNGRKIRHASSASSMGTNKSGTAAQGRKKNTGERPADLPVRAAPFGLFGNLSLRARSREPGEDEEEDKGAGIDNENFFRPSPAPDSFVKQLYNAQHQAPAILAKGIITPAEADKLFQIYFEEINLSVSLLDPVLYDSKRTFWRSPFLFTVICAISSRFYTARPELYQQAIHYAQLAAGTALISGTKNVEMCAAYMLLSMYPVPVKRWEQQRSWLYLGLAIRVGTDINLHLPVTAKPRNENHAREMLNRTRIWLNLYNLDRSTGGQYGKPPIINSNDYTANHSENWWKSSPYNMKHFDIQLCCYNAELRLMQGFIAQIYSDPGHPTGLARDVDFEAIATKTDDDLKALAQKWFSIIEQTDMTDPQNCFRTGLLRLAYSYARLLVLSYGFQHAFGKNDGQDENPFLTRCLNAATDVVRTVLDDICRPSQRHYWRHGPEAQTVFVTFASAFLVKLLQPKFASYISRDQRIEIRGMVQQVIDLLGSPEIAVDDRHGPKLYSRFLKSLLAKPLAKIDPTSPDGHQRTRSGKLSKQPSTSETPIPMSADSQTGVFNHSSPSTTASLSPACAESATDFSTFRPVGGVDPYAPDAPIMGIYDAAVGNTADAQMSDFFAPDLPFDDEILRSIQDLADPSGWQDISMPMGLNWMTQFQQNLGLDLRSQHENPAYPDTNMAYLTGNNQ